MTKPAVQIIKQPTDLYVDVVRNIQGIGWQSILLINRLSVSQRKTGSQAHKKRRLTFGALRTTMGLAKKEKCPVARINDTALVNEYTARINHKRGSKTVRVSDSRKQRSDIDDTR